MLETHLKHETIAVFGYKPTVDQNQLITKLSRFVMSEDFQSIFVLNGYAGTGKTTVVSAFINVLQKYKIQNVLLAPTGRAAKMISRYANFPAQTIHKKIYRQKSANKGLGEFVLDRNLHKNSIFWVDEASMISDKYSKNALFGSGKLLDDLIEYVDMGRNCKLVLIGDTAQLPPVGLNISPALDSNYLASHLSKKSHKAQLEKVVRQSEESGILLNATKIRKHLFEKPQGFVKLIINESKNVFHISGDELIDCIDDCYRKYEARETIVITRSNKRANLFNEGIRKRILFKEEKIETGDFLMVVKNNYFCLGDETNDFVANGEIVKLLEVLDYEEMYGFSFANVLLQFPDKNNLTLQTKILLDTLSSKGPALSSEESLKFFENIAADFKHINNKRKRYEAIRENQYYQALQVKFAYAVTCHKSQGGQWKAVFIDQGYLTNEMINKDFYRWFYTAVTRATEKLYFVNFRKDFF